MTNALETFRSSTHGEDLERVSCPICSADDSVVHRISHDRLFGLPGNYHVVRCRVCSMMYTNPRPTFASLGRHYPKDYFCYDPPDTLTGFRGWVLRSVCRGLLERRVRLLEDVTGRLPQGTAVCDVGCSHGHLLRALKERRGCDVVGVDFNPDMVEYGASSGVPMVQGTLEEARFESGSFDVVVMTEYLEHEARPREVLQEARRVTKPGGYLAIEVPLISTLGARVFGNTWSQLDLPRHLMFFTPQTIEQLLSEVGYEVVRVVKCPGSIGMSLLHALGYEGIGRMTVRDILATVLATAALLPFVPFSREFMYVVARAAPAPARAALPRPAVSVPRPLQLPPPAQLPPPPPSAPSNPFSSSGLLG